MPEPYRILVTGSRNWARPDIIWQALGKYRPAAAGRPIQIIHGMCDPRRADGARVPWAAAECLPDDEQQALLGADWLAGLFVTRMLAWGHKSYEPRRYPADWGGPCKPSCKPGHRRADPGGGTYCPAAGIYRNDLMAYLGADECQAFILNDSPGASDCLAKASNAGIPATIWRLP